MSGERTRGVTMSLPGSNDTIVALATAPGRGAIAIVRMSGPRAIEIARMHVDRWPNEARVATLGTVRDANGAVLDRAMVTWFEGPRSYTGEDLVEIATHGGVLAPTLVTAALVASGARVAERGELTRRAVLNGKIDLVQAEAIGDLVDAESRAGHRVALAQLDGGLSRRVQALREQVIALEALVAYDIDFPEEDDGPIAPERIRDATTATLAALDALLETAPTGELVRQGAVVVIAGAPNAGKSSLFNAMLGSARAIVTEIPGTTRDAIEAVLDGERWPIRLVDTAGLRETADVVERIGIEVSERWLAGADVVLACGEAVDDVRRVAAIAGQHTTGAIIGVRTKADLGTREADTGEVDIDVVRVSASSGEGLVTLRASIDDAIAARHGGAAPIDAPVLTRERQRHLVQRARDEIAGFGEATAAGELPATVAAVHLRAATDALGDVTGSIDVEDVLDALFRTFCVGK